MIYVSDLLPEKDMKQILQRTNMGVEAIEFSISDSLDHLNEKVKEYRSRIKYYGVTDLILHGPFLDLNPMAYDSQIQKVTTCRFAQAYEAGLQLGAKKIVYHTCFIPTVYYLDGWAERMADFFHTFLEGRTELQVLIENVLDRYPKPIKQVVDMVNAPNFKLCLDIGHANCYSELSPIRWAECFADSIGHVHLHNNDGTRDSHLSLDAGTAPARELLHIFKKIAPDATYTIECNTMEDVLRSYELARQFI